MHCEWMDEQPDFKKVVKLEGRKIGTIHAFTKLDYSKAAMDSDNFKDMTAASISLITSALTGYGCGWEYDRPVTMENVNSLPENVFNAFAKAVNEFENKNKITEEISKN